MKRLAPFLCAATMLWPAAPKAADSVAPSPVLGLPLEDLHWDMSAEDLRRVFPEAKPSPYSAEWFETPFSYAGCQFRLRFNFYKAGLNAIFLQDHTFKPKACVPDIERELNGAFGPSKRQAGSYGSENLDWHQAVSNIRFYHFPDGFLGVEFTSPHGQLVVEIDLH